MQHKSKSTNYENWLGRQGLHLLETLMQAEQERCDIADGLFDTVNNIF